MGENIVFGGIVFSRIVPGPGIDPADAGIATEPALLAPGELLRPGDGELYGLVEPGLAVEVGQQLLVAERLAGGAGQPAGAIVQGPATSARKPASIWARETGLDALVELGRARRGGRRAGRASADSGRGRDRTTRTGGRCRASPRGPARPGDGSSVPCATRRPGRARRAGACSSAVSPTALELGSHFGELAREIEVVDDGPQVQAGAPDEQRAMAPLPRSRPTRRSSPP